MSGIRRLVPTSHSTQWNAFEFNPMLLKGTKQCLEGYTEKKRGAKMVPLGELFSCPPPKEAPIFKTAPQGSYISSTFFSVYCFTNGKWCPKGTLFMPFIYFLSVIVVAYIHIYFLRFCLSVCLSVCPSVTASPAVTVGPRT